MARTDEKRIRRLAGQLEALRRQVEAQQVALENAAKDRFVQEATSLVMAAAIMALATVARRRNAAALDAEIVAAAQLISTAEATFLRSILASPEGSAGDHRMGETDGRATHH